MTWTASHARLPKSDQRHMSFQPEPQDSVAQDSGVTDSAAQNPDVQASKAGALGQNRPGPGIKERRRPERRDRRPELLRLFSVLLAVGLITISIYQGQTFRETMVSHFRDDQIRTLSASLDVVNSLFGRLAQSLTSLGSAVKQTRVEGGTDLTRLPVGILTAFQDQAEVQGVALADLNGLVLKGAGLIPTGSRIVLPDRMMSDLLGGETPLSSPHLVLSPEDSDLGTFLVGYRIPGDEKVDSIVAIVRIDQNKLVQRLSSISGRSGFMLDLLNQHGQMLACGNCPTTGSEVSGSGAGDNLTTVGPIHAKDALGRDVRTIDSHRQEGPTILPQPVRNWIRKLFTDKATEGAFWDVFRASHSWPLVLRVRVSADLVEAAWWNIWAWIGLASLFAGTLVVGAGEVLARQIVRQRSSDERLRLLSRAIGQSASGLVITDAVHPDNPAVYVNPAFEGITGYSASAALGKNLRFLHGADRDQPGLAKLRYAVETGQAATAEIRNYRPDGSRFWSEVSVTPVHDFQGNLTHWLGSQSDITGRREQEEKLILLSTAVEATASSILIADQTGIITWVNQAYVDASGYGFRDLTDRSHHLLDGAEEGRGIHADAWSALRQGEPWVGEVTERHRNGQLIVFQTTVTPIIDEHGTIRQFVSVQDDVTNRKRAEAELVRAKNAAEVANQAKSEFLAHMSHELRTPLNAIIGFSQMMQEQLFGPLPEKYREYAGDITASGEHLLSIINDILDMAKIEAGRFNLHEEIIHPGDVIDDVVSMIEPRLTSLDLNLSFRYRITPPDIRADRRALRQVLLNLLSNAVKFTRPGGQVIIGTGALSGADDLAGGFSIFVEDTGVGIDPDLIPTIFEPFNRARVEVAVEEEGTGLGLAISRRLMQYHGGDLRLESTLGEGTRVTAIFPKSRVITDPSSFPKQIPELDQKPEVGE
ncbi:MAG: PAS domain S-box protein [Magnetovibrionaceae bacterium]